MKIQEYRGLEFKTNKSTRCMIVDNNKHDKFIIINLDNYTTLARCNYDNIKETITNVKNNY